MGMGTVIIGIELQRRVRAFIMKVGTIDRAAKQLGCSAYTLDEARACGRMRAQIRDRLVAALDAAERTTEAEAAAE